MEGQMLLSKVLGEENTEKAFIENTCILINDKCYQDKVLKIFRKRLFMIAS